MKLKLAVHNRSLDSCIVNLVSVCFHNQHEKEFSPLVAGVGMMHLLQQKLELREHKQQVHCEALSFVAPVMSTNAC